MFKVGDEVLVKGEVVEVAKDVTYPIGIRFRCATVPMLFTEDELNLSTKTYEMGLKDAWELAKKILYGIDRQLIEILELNVEPAFFDLTHKRAIINEHAPEEVLAKIKAYEKEKEIKVGMIVVFAGEKWIVAEIKEDMLKLWSGKEIREARESSCEPTKGIIEVSNVLDR